MLKQELCEGEPRVGVGGKVTGVWSLYCDLWVVDSLVERLSLAPPAKLIHDTKYIKLNQN